MRAEKAAAALEAIHNNLRISRHRTLEVSKDKRKKGATSSSLSSPGEKTRQPQH